jgi:hypothetical protein
MKTIYMFPRIVFSVKQIQQCDSAVIIDFIYRPRFQLNLVLFRIKELPELANMVEEIVMPFMWAEDGFGEPSTKMADAIRYGLAAPEKFPMLAAVACFALGGLLILVALIYFVWQKRSSTVSKNIS